MGTDGLIRQLTGAMPFPDREATPAAATPPLAECNVAIVTTAGFRPSGTEGLWERGDLGFEEFASDVRDMQLRHFSSNFDRVGLAQDLNVVYPIDRLNEMAADGEIGAVNRRHFSFMGAQHDLSAIFLDSGPALAAELIADEVDLVLLTPI